MQQAWDGLAATASLNDELLPEDHEAIGFANFLRKTNFYWFAMMHKLLDPGMVYALEEDRKVNGQVYNVVKVGYEDGVGDVQDTYVLYINPETKLVDQFLFTIMDFGIAEPKLMEVKYETIDGVQLTTYRRYADANWNDEVLNDAWTEEITENVKFNNGFSPVDLQINF